MRIAKLIRIAFLSALLISHQAAASELPFSIPICKSDTDCDRDPTQLSQFVTDFYSWTLNEGKRNHDDWHSADNKPVYEAALTHEFYNNLDKIVADIDINPIARCQDILYTWPFNIKTDLASVTSKNHIFIVMFGTEKERYSLLVELKAENGTWRINNIRSVSAKNAC